MGIKCEHANRLWESLRVKADGYKRVLEKQSSAIEKWDLAFPLLDAEIKARRKEFGIAKSAVTNHHKTHRCE